MEKAKYILDGSKFMTLEDFYDEITYVFSLPLYWGRNLDAFNDVLRADFMPEGGYIIIWKNSALSEKFLGYEETVRQLSIWRKKCHPVNRARIEDQIKDAKAHRGPTVFDWLVGTIENHCKGGDEEKDGAELILE